jgi:predicted MFS family arabinose efflux permease
VSKGYAWFAAGTAAWALAAGMQQVLFAWLLVGELRESPHWVGIAQMCQALPWLAFLLIGGVAADHVDRRRLLIVLHLMAAVTVALIATALATGHLALAPLIAFALCWGTIQTFAQPARDALLSDVAGSDLMRAVTGSTLAQFAGLSLGTRLAGVAKSLGTAPALGIAALLLVCGAIPVWFLPRTPAPPGRLAFSESFAALRAGLDEVWHSERLRAVAFLVAANGVFYMGPYLVLCPLLVRDLYHGSVDDLALAMTSLTVGSIVGSILILRRGGVRRKGRAFLLALLTVALCLIAIALGPPYWAFVTFLFFWGVGHGFFLNTSRTLFQSAAPASHRARVLSVHSLGLLGMSPVSQLGTGLIAGAIGPLAGCGLAGGAMIVITGLAWSFTRVRYVE